MEESAGERREVRNLAVKMYVNNDISEEQSKLVLTIHLITNGSLNDVILLSIVSFDKT